jgi:hypothetical protein
MLILAMDANFRLKNRMRANDQTDPELGPGWAYFVNSAGYKKHLKNYISEEDVSMQVKIVLRCVLTFSGQISTCIVFAALMQKDTKLTTGLRCSGVGACICARHECVRPQGLGDLQKGER